MMFLREYFDFGNCCHRKWWLLVISLWLAEPSVAQEWTRFHGPNGTGIGQLKDFPAKLTDSSVNWKVELPGSGHSSPVLWGKKIFLTCTGDRAGGVTALCLNAQDGKVEWKRDFELSPFPRHQYNSYASSTPAVDAERVYVVWNERDHYMLGALDHAGKTVWQRDFGPFVSQHGCGVSPILCDDKVILTDFQDDPDFVEGPISDTRTGKSSILALDTKTGKTVWQTPRKSTVVTYSTPCLYEPKGGKRTLVFCNQAHGIFGLDASSGEPEWEYKQAFDKRTVSSPMVAGNIILGSCGNGGGRNFVTAIKPLASGQTPELAYQIKKSAPYVPTGIVINDLIWLWSDGGIVSCVTAASGEVRYQERVGGNYFGSPVCADGRIFCVSSGGELVVVEASDKFKVLDRYPLGELCRSTPAIAQGRLFVRTEKHLWSFRASKEVSKPE